MKTRTDRIGLQRIFLSLGLTLLAGTTLTSCTTKNPTYCDRPGDCPDDARDFSSASPDLAGTIEPLDLAAVGDLGRDAASSPTDLLLPSFDPGVPGPEKTVSFDVQVALGGREVAITVIGPSDDGKEITLRSAPHPIVVISPGFTLDRKQFTSYGTRLATYGLVAVLQKSSREANHAQYRDDTIALLDWLATPTGTSAPRVKDRVDVTRLGMAGHSLGGKISFMVAAQDARVKALLGIDPVDAGNPPALPEVPKIKLPTGIPVAFIGETTSKMGGVACTPAAGNYEAIYAKANPPAFAITVVGAAHNDFVDNFTMCATCGVCTGGTAPKTRTNQLAVKYTAAYFIWALGGDTRARDYFAGAAFMKDISDGYITRVTK